MAPVASPTVETVQKVQANVVAARYDVARLSLAPAPATLTPPGLQTFSPGSSQDTTVTFTNTTGMPVAGVALNLSVPKGWTTAVAGGTGTSKAFPDTVAPGASVSAIFKVTSGAAAFNGDLVGIVSWTNPATGRRQSERTAEKVRNVSPIKINEFRVSAGSPANPMDSFIKLYNAGTRALDISGWTHTQHPILQPFFSSVTVPAGTKIAAGGFYLMGLSNSGLAVPAQKGDTTIHVRSKTGMSVGDTIEIDAGSAAETHKIASIGSAAGAVTTLWQPVPDGPVITIPAGSTNVPVTSVAGFEVGQKIGIGYGATYPAVAKSVEKYEVVTVTAVGKQGTQAWLAADATAAANNLKVASVADFAPGQTILLDTGASRETAVIAAVGTAGAATAGPATAAGATVIPVSGATGFSAGQALTIDSGTFQETAVVASIAFGRGGPGNGASITVAAPLASAHGAGVQVSGTGITLASALTKAHAVGVQVAVSDPTPGAPNRYDRKGPGAKR